MESQEGIGEGEGEEREGDLGERGSKRVKEQGVSTERGRDRKGKNERERGRYREGKREV